MLFRRLPQATTSDAVEACVRGIAGDARALPLVPALAVPDLVVTNSSANTVSVLVNTTDTTATAPSANPRSVAIGDFNGDGKLDLAVGNADSQTVSVLLSR